MDDFGDHNDSEYPIVPLEFDPTSYRAGMEMGELKANLAGRQVSALAWSVRQENLRAADLIAMAYGYVLRVYGHHGGMCQVEIQLVNPEFVAD